MQLADANAEKAVLAGIFRYGQDAFLDVADIVNTNTFTSQSNSVIYSCIRDLYEKDQVQTIDMATIVSKAQEIGYKNFFNNQELQNLTNIQNHPVDKSNIRRLAAKTRKLQISRMMYDQLESTQQKYLELNGDEKIAHILGIAEESIFNFTSLLNDVDDTPELLFNGFDELLLERAANPVDQVGIPTGFSRFDKAIGGGLRRGSVSMIGARTKVGKSLIGLNMGVNIAEKDIPVLYLDTEMTKEDQQTRGGAMVSYGNSCQSTINDIETGKFASTDHRKNAMVELAKNKKNLKFYHKNIGGMPFEDQLSIMRRWLVKTVGLNDKGMANDCVIIYDYLKLMDAAELKDMQEFQVLGLMMTSLHNFALRYKVPILGFIQLNRDGITKESTDAASGSDRIVWLCSNFTIYKLKSDEEIAADGPEHGNRKLVPIISRHGGGLPDKEYINVNMHGEYAKLIEGETSFEIRRKNNNVNTHEEEDIAF